MTEVIQYITLSLVLLVALRTIIGFPPISMWFRHPKPCERCKGLGWHL